MAWCLQAPSHYLNQCYLDTNEACWHLAVGNFTETVLEIAYYKVSKNYKFENTVAFPWVKLTHCGLVTPYGDIDRGQHWLR